MSRNLRSAMAVTAIALAASASGAAGQMGFSVAGGPTLATGTLGDVVDMGYHAQLSIGLAVPALPVGIRLDGAFNQFPETGHDHNFRVLSGSANAVLNIPSAGITPYIIGGLGFYNWGFTDDDDDEDHGGKTTDLGLNVGVGVRLGLPGLGVFAETRYHNLFNDGNSIRFVPISLGIRF